MVLHFHFSRVSGCNTQNYGGKAQEDQFRKQLKSSEWEMRVTSAGAEEVAMLRGGEKRLQGKIDESWR